ncbi:nucleotidyltransferase [Aliivibrio sp. 1S165]|uniref:nucleotidyltransferase domain-containing protein n=1 Tax=unclassified Aliivibrio TaxID=2645654 RepID=UPI00080ECDB0|nr:MULTISPECIES: nucleotidyltransferase domain-containing protein [unclassified Aliivibrio]OCH15366.1 nucleotidyltransferase [Aliivibrio sp. 1S165]OCH34640.1 nucleotidyltransferase [Aliivibrio sp. 1S175]
MSRYTLPNIDKHSPFQKEFEPAIQDLIVHVRSAVPKSIHSIYLYGSVARREAISGRSNLDVTLITTVPLTNKEQTLINTIKIRFQSKYPQITGVTFTIGEVTEVLQLESIFSWGFWLRHCCVCILGDDLSTRFGDFEPSWEIAKNMNIDIQEWLQVYTKKISVSTSINVQVEQQKTIAKKLLRSCYSLVMHRDKGWYDHPVLCARKFLEYYPEKQTEIERVVMLLKGRKIPKRSTIALLEEFGGWVVSEFNKIERRIG